MRIVGEILKIRTRTSLALFFDVVLCQIACTLFQSPLISISRSYSLPSYEKNEVPKTKSLYKVHIKMGDFKSA